MKAFGDERIADGESCLVVDLGGCTGMDSTFMGTLAGMAARLSALRAGVLQIADSGERNRRSLEDLGLDFLIEIDPPAAVWRGRVDLIRTRLEPQQAAGPLGQTQRTRHVLDAHRNLADLNDENAEKFEEVVHLLENELAGKEQQDAATDKPADQEQPVDTAPPADQELPAKPAQAAENAKPAEDDEAK